MWITRRGQTQFLHIFVRGEFACNNDKVANFEIDWTEMGLAIVSLDSTNALLCGEKSAFFVRIVESFE